MRITSKLIKVNIINSLIIAIFFITYYNRCGKSFDYCLPLIEFFVIYGIIALVSGFWGSTIAKDTKNKLLNGTLAIVLSPFVVILLSLILLGIANIDVSDLFFQFYVLPIAFIGALIGTLIYKVKVH
ncbi:hypothetical protein KY347_00770 [Candidatus Woesearchaeota archaeon]|nr:hypothetical protein [Candidatus Woesearchaeota archaeon]